MSNSEKLDLVLDTVVNLISNGSINQSELYIKIREVLKSNSKSLKQVVYNDRYGGFGVTKEFMNFYKTDHDIMSNEYREIIALQIPLFGEKICKEYPILWSLIYNFLYYEPYIGHINEYKQKMHKYKSNKINTEIIKTVLNEEEFGCIDYIDIPLYSWGYKFNKDYLKKYTKDALERLINATMKENDTLDSTLRDISDQLRINGIDVGHIEKFKVPREVHVDMDIPQTFMNALETFGSCNGNNTLINKCIWQYQHHVNSSLMQYLHTQIPEISLVSKYPSNHVYDLMRNDGSFIEVEDIFKKRTECIIGLICASDEFSALQIANVPSLVDWRISEYDGLENVCIL